MAPELVPPPWKPRSANVVGSAAHRELYLYRAALEQFDVTECARYQPKGGQTFCNIYVWDCTRALGCEIPHWVTSTGDAAKSGQEGAIELSANAIKAWLDKHGTRMGWIETTSWGAHEAASKGQPVVAVYQAEKGHGHIAMILPGPNSTLHVAQAGKFCLFDAPLAAGFGKHFPTFYRHA